MRAKLLLLAVVATTGVTRRASAAEGLELSWHAPVGCPSAAQVRDAALRTASPEVAREPIDADVRVEHAERWTVTIRTQRAGVTSAERHLEASSCAALADATAVILALALIPAATSSPALAPTASAPEPAPAVDPATNPAPPAPPTPPPPPPAAPARASAAGLAPAVDADITRARRPASHALAAGASLLTDGTTLPGPALGGRVNLAWTPGRARLELGGAYFFDQSKTTATSGAGATFTLLTAGGRGCWAVVRGAVELSPCAGAEVAMLKARGFGASANYDASAAWIEGAVGALFRVPLSSWLALRADADAIVPFSRPRFVVEGDGAVHQAASLGVRGAIGAELLFL